MLPILRSSFFIFIFMLPYPYTDVYHKIPLVNQCFTISASIHADGPFRFFALFFPFFYISSSIVAFNTLSTDTLLVFLLLL